MSRFLPNLLRITDIAKRCSVHRATVSRWIQTKKLPVHSIIAGGPRVSEDDLLEAIKRGRQS